MKIRILLYKLCQSIVGLLNQNEKSKQRLSSLGQFFSQRSRAANELLANAHSISIRTISSLILFKGQLISECLFDILNFPKTQRKI